MIIFAILSIIFILFTISITISIGIVLSFLFLFSKKLYLNIMLDILSIILLVLFLPLGWIYTNIKFIRKKISKTEYTRYYLLNAVSNDQKGNVVLSYLLNDILIKSEENKFGDPDETISSVLGKNKIDNSLTKVGIFLDKILSILDNNHSIKSIDK